MKRDHLTPLKAIRAKCLDCSAGSVAEVRKCHITDCSLYPFRFGHNPNRARIGCRNAKFRRKAQLNKGFSKEKDKDKKLVKEFKEEKISS